MPDKPNKIKKDLNILLQKYWNHKSFRPLQQNIIEDVIDKKDVLALLPTGGGKSICFQLPAIILDGICIVVSPLIALMQEQVESLNQKGIKSACINSFMQKREIDITLDNCIYSPVKLLYVSPERLKTSMFLERFKKMNVSFIAVDEAHCISQWGYDFRPSYLEIAELKKIKPDLHFIALTATATKQVVADIQDQLLFAKHNVIKRSFYRHNLSYHVKRTENKLIALEQHLTKDKGSAIVYVRSRRKCHELSDFLNKRKLNSTVYHAGLNNKERNQAQISWLSNETRIIVATNAFGMGIDKPDVRTVINYDLPESIEAYFQEAGRAGRDEKEAIALLFVKEQDRTDLKDRVLQSYPCIDTVRTVYQKLCNIHQIAIGSGEGISYPLNLDQLLIKDNINKTQVFHSLRLLELTGHIIISRDDIRSSQLKFEMIQHELSAFQTRNPKYDPVIKNMLRSYAGLFDYYSNINENILAKRIGVSITLIKQILEQLHDMKVITYLPKNEDTLITFMEPRKDIKRLFLKNEIYSQRKENDINRMNSIIHYAYSNESCRNAILLHYFNENYTEECEKCDICQSTNRNTSEKTNENIAKAIRNNLSEHPMDIDKLIAQLCFDNNKPNVTDVLRKMLDADEITINKLNQIQLL